MNQRLTPGTIVLLMVPPLLWACNAVVGRMLNGLVPPMTLNFLRWALAFLLLLPLAGWVLKPGSGLMKSWRRFALLGLLGVGLYNALQYLALKTSTPINVTLVAASNPVFMLIIGALFFGQRIARHQVLGAALSLAGVLLVLARGQWDLLMQLHLVPGDIFVAGDRRLGLLQLAAEPARRARGHTQRLGRLHPGADRLWPAVVRQLCRGRMGGD